MKHVVLSLLAVACGAFSASALDATKAQIWISDKVQPDFAAIGSGIAHEKLGSLPTYVRSWQYLSIPVRVQGAIKGDVAPHYIPELKVRISVAVATADSSGRATDNVDLLTKEITYVDIPLAKGKKDGPQMVADGMVNVGVFISPSNAFKLSPKDGSLAKKVVAVAVEGEFKGSNCNRPKEKANDGVATGVVLDAKLAKNFPDEWWKKKGGSSAVVVAMSETPFAADYGRYGFPATKPLYGPASAAASSPAADASGASSPSGAAKTADSSSSDSSVPAAAYDPRAAEAAAQNTAASTSDAEEDVSQKGKKGKKARR